MSEARSRLAVIPARGGSKRIENKNVRDFCGKPLIAYPLRAAEESGLFDRIHVSTEDEGIRSVVEGLGHPVEFLRDPALSDDMTGLMPVLRWVVRTYAERGLVFDDVCMIFATAALIEASDLLAGWAVYEGGSYRRPVLSVSEFPVPAEWAMKMRPSGRLRPDRPESLAIRSQDLEKSYFETGAFVFYNASHLLGESSPSPGDYLGCVLPREKSVDIDDEGDLKFAKIIFRGREAK